MKTLIIAEAGKNFIRRDSTTVQEALANARELVDAAKRAGADVIKFQCHVAKDECKTRTESRHGWIEYNEKMTPLKQFWMPLKRYCEFKQISFLVTPMSKMAAEKIEPIVSYWKVGSGNVTDKELLVYLRMTGKPVILSTGMSTRTQIEEAIHIVKPMAVMHCVSLYPCPREKANLIGIRWLKVMFQGLVGYSDHTVEVGTSVVAVAMGAKIIEKHFTIDKTHSGPDHAFSLDESEFTKMVTKIRKVEEMIGIPNTNGWEEILQQPKTLVIVEWPEKIAAVLPEHRQHLLITHNGDQRTIKKI